MEVGSSRKGVRRKKSHLYLTFLFFFLFRCCCCWFFSCYIIIPFSLLLLFSLPLSDALQRSKENKQKEKINACTLCRLVTRCCMRFFLRLTRTHTHTHKRKIIRQPIRGMSNLEQTTWVGVCPLCYTRMTKIRISP